ncbi:Ger(x)C family spore germination protein [Filibacter tadaridae]|uniref:Spore germination protein A3 n=1 Tax=Filibacter tadaridae TaxID=2483811 RepID=A0A3P5X5N2_9BACL|nr:Ger(x)C family spore germination protein [Filibacter tadaridae]VDC22574.1 Spore germination protein A3 precursor [Filibacter tadaridae]
MSTLSKRKRIFLVIIVCITGIFQTGCAFKDINKRAFVAGIGIDPGEDDDEKYKVTLKIAIPIGSLKQAKGPTYSYLSYEGETIGESIRMLETHIDKTLEFGHAKILVINEKLLSDDLGQFMDYFTRRGDLQLIAWVAAGRPSAEQVLKTEPETESPASVALFNFFDDSGTESPYITTTFLFQFRRDFFAIGLDSVLPLVEASENGKELIINNSLVVKDKQDPLELTPVETKDYNSLASGMVGFSYKVKHGDLTLLLNIDTVKMNYKIITEQGSPPRVDMNVKMIGIIGESSTDLAFKNLKKYNEYASKAMEKKVVKLLTILQENELDPFGFGLRYRATRLSNKNTISKWNSMYPNLEFDVTVDVELKSTGAIE